MSTRPSAASRAPDAARRAFADDVAFYLTGRRMGGSLMAADATHLRPGLMARFEHLNPGMQRMNLGNMIRKIMNDQAKGAK